MKNRLLKIVFVAFFAGVFFSSCEDEYKSSLVLDADVTISEFSVDGVQGVIDESKKTIVVTVPDGTDISSVNPTIQLGKGAVITPAITESMDFSNPIEFQIVDGDVFSKYTISVTEQFFIGFLGTASSVSEIEEDDQKAAAEWFFSQYENGVYISFDEIKNGSVDINDFRVLWWYYDSGRALPEIALDADVLNKINNFHKDGGNLMFNGHACAYFWNLGRMTGEYNLVIGDAEGSDNGDTWSIGISVGTHFAGDHPIYKDVTFNTDDDGYKWIPIISAGWKEDHNHTIIDIPGYHGYGNADEDAFTAFTETHNLEWLGVWGGIRDYWMAGVLEFLPTEVYKGKAIYQGIGGFEFNQNAAGEINADGVNLYQSNIELISKNSLNYLSQKN